MLNVMVCSVVYCGLLPLYNTEQKKVMGVKLDQIDIAMLNLLQQDASLGVKEIAARVGLSQSPTFERLKKLKQEGYIKKIVALVDNKKLDKNMVAICMITLKEQGIETKQNFEAQTAQMPEVMEVLCVSGGWDYILKVATKDMPSFHHFISNRLAPIQHIANINSNFILNEVKYDTAFLIEP